MRPRPEIAPTEGLEYEKYDAILFPTDKWKEWLQSESVAPGGLFDPSVYAVESLRILENFDKIIRQSQSRSNKLREIYNVPPLEILEDRLIQVAKSFRLSSRDEKEVAEFALAHGYFQMAREFGAKEEEIFQHELGREVCLHIFQLFHSRRHRPITAEDIEDLLGYLKDSKRRGYKFQTCTARFGNPLVLLVHSVGDRVSLDLISPIVDFLISANVNPTESSKWGPPALFVGRGATVETMGETSKLGKYIWSKWLKHQARNLHNQLTIRENLIWQRAEPIPHRKSQEQGRELSRPIIRKILREAAIREVCDDIIEGNIPPAQLFALARYFGIPFTMETSWSELCHRVIERLKGIFY